MRPHTVTQADLDAGSVINTASATGLDPNLVVVSDDSAPVTVDWRFRRRS